MLKKVCRLSDLSEGKGKKFFIDDEDVAIFLIKGKVFALSNICPHQHSSIIHEGFLEDDFVVCPAHGWKFNIHNGKKEGKYNGLKSYSVMVENGEVFIEMKKNTYKYE
ncbi:MAG: Rieske (2Fe-2S) protein [Ignavibacterium sp.]|nr:Rieske (2Fe-2S) protein [Ignavibacterium sp.]